jgi:hypothetical protein
MNNQMTKANVTFAQWETRAIAYAEEVFAYSDFVKDEAASAAAFYYQCGDTPEKFCDEYGADNGLERLDEWPNNLGQNVIKLEQPK